MKEIYEVRTTHVDDNNLVHFDVYFTDDDNEAGTLAGFYDLDTGKVIPVDNLLMNDPKIKEGIKAIREDHVPEAVLIEYPEDCIPLKSKWDYLSNKDLFEWEPDRYPCLAVYVKTEFRPDDSDQPIYCFLYPKNT